MQANRSRTQRRARDGARARVAIARDREGDRATARGASLANSTSSACALTIGTAYDDSASCIDLMISRLETQTIRCRCSRKQDQAELSSRLRAPLAFLAIGLPMQSSMIHSQCMARGGRSGSRRTKSFSASGDGRGAVRLRLRRELVVFRALFSMSLVDAALEEEGEMWRRAA